MKVRLDRVINRWTLFTWVTRGAHQRSLAMYVVASSIQRYDTYLHTPNDPVRRQYVHRYINETCHARATAFGQRVSLEYR